MDVEDFSFPAACATPESPRRCNLPFPHFAASPVWFARHHRRSRSSSSTTSEEIIGMEFPSYVENSHSNQDQDSTLNDYGLDGKVDRSPDMDSKASCDSGDGSKEAVNEEERMDMLWEELNEELHPILPYGFKGGKKLESDSHSHGKAEPCSLRMFRSCSSLVHCRRVVMMLKVLKRLFLIQKVSSSKRASSLCQI